MLIKWLKLIRLNILLKLLMLLKNCMKLWLGICRPLCLIIMICWTKLIIIEIWLLLEFKNWLKIKLRLLCKKVKKEVLVSNLLYIHIRLVLYKVWMIMLNKKILLRKNRLIQKIWNMKQMDQLLPFLICLKILKFDNLF